jgi:signal-transduction protein with cAMP-binding, CBS, and nucleotidyltransferase domain
MVMAFLHNIPPFQFLAPTELTRLASHMTLQFFPKDAVILSAGGPKSDVLYVVHKGGVKLALTSQVGKRMTLDMRSEGEMFGLLSVMGREPARLDVTAIEDTLCYSVPAEDRPFPEHRSEGSAERIGRQQTRTGQPGSGYGPSAPVDPEMWTVLGRPPRPTRDA